MSESEDIKKKIEESMKQSMNFEMDDPGKTKSHLEKIMSIDGFCEMKHNSGDSFLFIAGTLLQDVVKAQEVSVLDPDAKRLVDTYIAGITVGSDNYSQVHKEAKKGEEVQMVLGTNFTQCPDLKTKAKYLCAIVFDD